VIIKHFRIYKIIYTGREVDSIMIRSSVTGALLGVRWEGEWLDNSRLPDDVKEFALANFEQIK
jgi:hypothetical protein